MHSKCNFFNVLPMKHYKTLSELHRDNGWPAPQNPLFSIVGCQSACPLGNREYTTDSYMIAFKKIKSGTIMYGKTPYDHDNGSMFFTKPRQIIEMKDLELEEQGFMLFIHEDYLYRNELYSIIQQYAFFDYETNEAIHLSPAEELIVWELYNKINIEYLTNPDEFTREIILSHVASILKYVQRFYKRQFIDRKQLSGRIVSKFNAALKQHLNNGKLKEDGLPSVTSLASQLLLSPRYLSDLLKQETGKTAMELIHVYLITEAKNLLRSGDKGIAEIAFQLGFENASYFSRLFKKQTGLRPLDFKHTLN